jgi:GxxExxY protein
MDGPRGMHRPLTSATEMVASEVVAAAFEVHKALGPGLLESVYEACLAYELRDRGLGVETQVVRPVVYKGVQLESALRLDMLVEDLVIVEVKAVEQENPVHWAQVLSYLRLAGLRLGFLVNFNVPLIKDGIKRLIV